MKPAFYSDAAKADLLEAIRWYESQRAGLAAELLDEIARVRTVISEHPKRYPIVEENVREALLARFPYCLYYVDFPNRIAIIAVHHHSQDPGAGRAASDLAN